MYVYIYIYIYTMIHTPTGRTPKHIRIRIHIRM